MARQPALNFLLLRSPYFEFLLPVSVQFQYTHAYGLLTTLIDASKQTAGMGHAHRVVLVVQSGVDERRSARHIL